MGNNVSKKEDVNNSNKSLILLDDSFINNFRSENDLLFEKKNPNVILENTNTPFYKHDTSKTEEDHVHKNQLLALADRGSDYEDIKRKIVNELIIESEKYINEQKQELTKLQKASLADPFSHVSLEKHQCSKDEMKILDCMKDMNRSTTSFVNYYNKCNQYLQAYEKCVHEGKS